MTFKDSLALLPSYSLGLVKEKLRWTQSSRHPEQGNGGLVPLLRYVAGPKSKNIAWDRK